MFNHTHRRITIADIPVLLNKAYLATMNKAVSGFNAAEIVPFNPDKVSIDDFAPAEEFKELIVEPETDNEFVIQLPKIILDHLRWP